MADNKPAAGGNVTKDWQATQDQKSAATRLRIFAALSWAVAIGGEIAASRVNDSISAQLAADSFEWRDGSGGDAVVITKQDIEIVGVGSDDRDGF